MVSTSAPVLPMITPTCGVMEQGAGVKAHNPL